MEHIISGDARPLIINKGTTPQRRKKDKKWQKKQKY